MSSRRLNGEAGEVMNMDYGWSCEWTYKTDVTELIGGNEQRRARWEFPLRKYTIIFGNKTITNLNVLRQFFYDHKGQYDSFYFYDPNSRMTWIIPTAYKVTSGTAVTKVYLPFRYIKPMDSAPTFGTDIRVYVSATEVTTNIAACSTEGSVSFTASYPTSTQAIAVDYEYYTKVRFASDSIKHAEKTWNLADTTLDLVEAR